MKIGDVVRIRMDTDSHWNGQLCVIRHIATVYATWPYNVVRLSDGEVGAFGRHELEEAPDEDR